MKAKIVKMGRSFGIVLPRTLLGDLKNQTMVDVYITQKGIAIEPTHEIELQDYNSEDDLFLFTDLSHEFRLEK